MIKSNKLKWFSGVLIICLLYWTADSIWSYLSFEINLRALIFSEPRTLTDTLLLRTTPYQVVSRLTLTVVILICGWLLYKYINMVRSSEKRMRTSERQLRSTFNAATFPIAVFSQKNASTLFSNSSFLGLFVAERDNPPDVSVDQIFEDPDLPRNTVEKIKSEMCTATIAARVRTTSGQWIWGLISFTPMIYQNEPALFMALMDITRQKEAEQEAESAFRKWRSIVDNAVVGFYQLTEDGCFLLINPKLAEMFGYSSAEEMISSVTNATELYSNPDDRFRAVNKLNTEGFLHAFETQLKNKSGSMMWFRINARRIFQDGQVVYEGFIEDISEAKNAQKALELSEEKYRQLVENAYEGIVVAQDGLFKWFNPSFPSIMGRSEEELRTDKWERFIHPDDQDKVVGRHKKRLKGEGQLPYRYSFKIIRADGAERTVEMTVVRIQWEGRPAALCFISDITEKMQAESEKESLEQQLRQSQKMEALGTLAGGIAHDFNNILAAIIGYSELALEDAQEGMASPQQIGEILKAGMRAKELVDQILTFSRKMEPRLKPINLNRVISQTEALLERTIPKMIKIEHRLADDLWLINADAGQMTQVLMNICTNANDAMPDGGSLIIETDNVTLDEEYADHHVDAKTGDYVQLTVSDTGCGMDRDTQEHIFDPFFTNKEIGKGTGLGLATVYGIIKNHGGCIMCYSEIAQGTTFKVFLPAIRYSEPAEVPEAEPVEIAGGSETILLVDDEAAMRKLSQRILTRHGYKTLLAQSGEEALEIYSKPDGGIDLVVLDVNMPGMGGHNCLPALLKINPEAKVIISSGYSQKIQLKETLLSGAAGFIPKPYKQTEMLKTIREVLDR